MESDGLPVSLRPKNFGACGRTRTHEGQSSPPDLQSGAFAAQPHMRIEISDLKSQISNLRFQIPDPFMLKNR